MQTAGQIYESENEMISYVERAVTVPDQSQIGPTGRLSPFGNLATVSEK